MRLPTPIQRSYARGRRDFDPPSVPGTAVQFWYRTDRGWFQDAGLATPAGPGDPIGGRQDYSGNARHAVQATAAERPTLLGAASGPAASFDGVDDLLTTTYELSLGSQFQLWLAVWAADGGGTNELSDPRDLTTASWSASAAVARDAVGVDGAPNTATTVTDGSGAATQNALQDVSIPNDTARHAVVVHVQKDADETRFPALTIQMFGGTLAQRVVQLNTATGAVSVNASSATGDQWVEDVGDFWRLVVLVDNNGSGNTTLRYVVQPARGTTISNSSPAATGSIVVDACSVELDSTAPSFFVQASRVLWSVSAAVQSGPYIYVALDVDRKIEIRYRNDAGGGASAVSAAPLAIGAHSIALEFDDGTSSIQVYVDTVEVASLVLAGSFTGLDVVTWGGLDATTYAEPFDERIGEAWLSVGPPPSDINRERLHNYLAGRTTGLDAA